MWDEEGGEGITYRLYMPPTHPTWSNFGFRFFSYKLVRCIWECAVDAKYFFFHSIFGHHAAVLPPFAFCGK